MDKKRTLFILISLALISIGGIILVLITSSRMGPGLSPDSVAYIAAARNILNGHGVLVLYNTNGTIPLSLWQPMNPGGANNVVLWPPGYPILLSLTGIFGLNVLTGARWLNALLFGINIFLIGYIIKKITITVILPLLTAILLVFTTDIILIHHMVWSEPLFIFLSVLGLFILINYLTSNKIKYLYLSAFILGLAFFTKYSGASLILSGVIGILFLNPEKFSKKITRSIIFIIISCLPVGIWLARLMFLNNVSSVRNFNFSLIKNDEIKLMLDNITKWLLPGRIPLNYRVLLTGIFIILILTGFLIINKKIKNKQIGADQIYINISCKIFFIFTCFYVSFLFINRILSDANFDFYDNRSLTPILIFSLIIVVLLLKSIINAAGIFKPQTKITKTVISFLLVIYIGFYAANFFYGHNVNTFANLYKGVGYSRDDWKTNRTIEELKKFPESVIIYSNEPIAIYILTGRTSLMIPSKKYIYSNKTNYQYLNEVKTMGNDLKAKKGVIVLFKVGLGFLPKDNELKEQMQLHLLKPCPDGAIYEVY